jgi:hypothetical protein
MEGDFRGVQGGKLQIESGAHYQAYFFNPRTGEDRPVGPVTPDAEGLWPVPNRPTMEDWVLVLEDRDALAGD